MTERIEQLRREAEGQIAAAATSTALEELRVRYLGRKSELTGILRSIAISVYPELEMLLIYLIVIAVLVLRPRGLFGGAAA